MLLDDDQSEQVANGWRKYSHYYPNDIKINETYLMNYNFIPQGRHHMQALNTESMCDFTHL